MKTFWANEITLTHEDYRRLHLAGKCNLGVPNDLAEKIAVDTDLMADSSAGSKNWIGIFLSLGVMIYSIYLSFTWAWWSFIPGWLIGGIISIRNRKSTAKDVLKYALNNEDFYLKLTSISSVSFQMDDETSTKYL